MATTKTADSSVVVALSELVRMEHDRIVSDREREQERIAEAERERADAAAKEAERVARERREQEARVAEAEARLRVEADRERDERMAVMRAELARVESERLAMREDLERRRTAPSASRPNGWALAFGLSSLVAASLAGLLVLQQGPHDAPIASAAPISAPALVPAPGDRDIVLLAPAPQPEPVAEAPVATAPATRERHHRTPRAEQSPASHGTELVGLGTDDGTDDVLGPDLVRDAHRTLTH